MERLAEAPGFIRRVNFTERRIGNKPIPMKFTLSLTLALPTLLAPRYM